MVSQIPSSRRPPSTTIITAVVCIALGAVAAAMASLNVAIPNIVRATHASQVQLEWIIDAYLLVFAVLLLPAGAIGDRYGRRKALIAGLLIFGGASAAAMATTSPDALIGLRGLIGAGAALVMPATLSTITGTFPPAERSKAIGIWAGVAGGAAILGLLCSGILLEWFSWRSVFAVNVVLARDRHRRRDPLRPRVLPAGRAGGRQGRCGVRHRRSCRACLQHHRGARRRLAERPHPRRHRCRTGSARRLRPVRAAPAASAARPAAVPATASSRPAACRSSSSSSPSSASPSSPCSTCRASAATPR